MAFSPDGQYLAAGENRTLRLWDPSAGATPLWSVSHPRTNGRTFCFSPDGLSVLLRWNDRTFCRYDVRTGQATADSLLTELNPFLFSPDGRFAVATSLILRAGGNGMLCARAAAAGGWDEVWRKEYPRVPDIGWAAVFEILEFSPDSARLTRVFRRGAYRPMGDMGIEVFAAESGDVVAQWEGELPCRALEGAVSPTGVVVVLNARSVYTVDPFTPNSKPVQRQNATRQHFTAAAFARDGTRLATASNDTAATVWDTSTWEVRKRYEWRVGRLRTVCFAPDGLRCAAASDTGQIVVWDLDD